MTGFEGYLIGAAIVLVLLLWRALGRHVTVNQHNDQHQQADASASAAPGPGQSGASKALPVALLIVVGVVVVSLAAVAGHVEAPQAVPVVQPVQAPIIVTVAPAQPVDEYQMTRLPDAQSGVDFTPLLVLAVLGIATVAPLYLLSHRKYKPATAQRIAGRATPQGITHPAFDIAAIAVKSKRSK
jgi:hypothetical protein